MRVSIVRAFPVTTTSVPVRAADEGEFVAEPSLDFHEVHACLDLQRL
jgi:hypothetical protein